MTHPLEDDNRRLRTALEECANDLEAELLYRYGSPAHPAMQRRFDRDFSTVVDARAALAAEPASGEVTRSNDPDYLDPLAMIAAIDKRKATPPPPPTQGEEERARTVLMRLRDPDEQELDVVAAALRQRADEATREAEAIVREALAKIRSYADDHDDEMVPILIDEALAAIRARIAPKGQS